MGMENKRLWYIYVLKDPRDNAVRYVGWSYDVRKRMSAHISSAPRLQSHKARWIRILLEKNLYPILEVVEFGTGSWSDAERKWIAHYRELGVNLTNMTDGGDGTPGYIPNEVTRQKMSIAHTGRKQTPESTAKTKAALLGRKKSPEHIQKMSENRKGKIPWAATNAAAEKIRGSKQSPEHIEKRFVNRRGVPLMARKLQPDQIREIREARGLETQRSLAKRFGVGVATINDIQHRKRYTDITD